MSIPTRRRLLHRAAFVTLATSWLGAVPARADLLAFEFTTIVDATDYGLSATEPLTIRYRYDPLTVPLVYALGTPVVRNGYGPVPGSFTIGGYTVSFVAQLAIDDENNGHDSYSLDAASYLANTTVTGSVSGISVSSFNLYLLDQTQPISMLSSLDPPASAAFAYQASLVRAYFSDYSNQKVVIRDFAPVEFGLFDFTVPEPGAAGSALAAAGTLAVVARRRVIARERGRHGP